VNQAGTGRLMRGEVKVCDATAVPTQIPDMRVRCLLVCSVTADEEEEGDGGTDDHDQGSSGRLGMLPRRSASRRSLASKRGGWVPWSVCLSAWCE
jgi:hypothetical protein